MTRVDVTAATNAHPLSRGANRVDTLDITKGLLVILMVVYHTINYSTQFFLAFRYMAFLPPTFIILAGFLLTRVYGERPAPRRAVNTRLFLRGGKLLLVFTALNIAAQFARSGNYHGQSLGLRNFIVHWPDTFLIGGSRAAAFEILLPIAYILLLAPGLLWLDRIHRSLLPLFTSMVIITVMAADRTGTSLPNLNLLSAGLVGMLLGRFSWNSLGHLKSCVLASLFAYALYALAAAKLGQSFLLQMAGAVISLAAIYGIALWIESLRKTAAWLTRLGLYSLLAYIVQIAILQLLSHVFGRPDPFSSLFYLLMGATLVLTAIIADTVHWIRARVRAADYAYRAVFP